MRILFGLILALDYLLDVAATSQLSVSQTPMPLPAHEVKIPRRNIRSFTAPSAADQQGKSAARAWRRPSDVNIRRHNGTDRFRITCAWRRPSYASDTVNAAGSDAGARRAAGSRSP